MLSTFHYFVLLELLPKLQLPPLCISCCILNTLSSMTEKAKSNLYNVNSSRWFDCLWNWHKNFDNSTTEVLIFCISVLFLFTLWVLEGYVRELYFASVRELQIERIPETSSNSFNPPLWSAISWTTDQQQMKVPSQAESTLEMRACRSRI